MRAIYLVAVGLALSGGALAQSQNIARTGAGSPFDTLEALQSEISEYSNGRLGRAVKGAGGLAGIAATLSVAHDVLNFRVRADGSVVPGGGVGGSSGGTANTSAAISSSASTN